MTKGPSVFAVRVMTRRGRPVALGRSNKRMAMQPPLCHSVVHAAPNLRASIFSLIETKTIVNCSNFHQNSDIEFSNLDKMSPFNRQPLLSVYTSPLPPTLKLACLNSVQRREEPSEEKGRGE
ncbi:hypothetical protein KQX54_019246 [Cotesia glomerata]|uniref:Uncharacterized protein n=1 Tax=Cotesia glomerata TaxID=32391 RepID=A0AAV7J0I9_COTGL|nr:hypothetical protein KQX54_019246 [Cotesia glomerata]